MIQVYRYRVKNLAGLLQQQARAVNVVWNYCNDVQKSALTWNKPWPSGFDLNVLTTGSSKALGLHSGAVNAVCEQYAKSRNQHKKPFLRYRGCRSLGWVPLKGRNLKREGNAFRFAGHTFRLWYSRPLPVGKIKDGTNFAQDSRRRWYLNIAVEIPDVQPRAIERAVGDPKQFAKLADKLAQAQRANKKRLATHLHARIKNARKDFLHKASHRIVRDFDYIAVGNVNAAGLAKTRLAKSVLDAGWSSFRNMLRYKAIARGAWYEEVNERFSTQVCSACGSLPEQRPKRIADLGIREWTCGDCGCVHDRDQNAASNILRVGHHSPVVGIPGRYAGAHVKSSFDVLDGQPREEN